MRAAFPLKLLPATTSTWRRKLMVAVRALVVVVIFIFILHSANVATIVTRLNAATALVFAAGVVLLLGQAGLCTARWRLLLESAPPPTPLARQTMAFVICSNMQPVSPHSGPRPP